MIRRCKQSFAAVVKGTPRVIAAGALVDSADPIMKGREALFEDVDAYMADKADRQSRPVEAATAEPGEKRTVKPRSTGRAKKPDGE